MKKERKKLGKRKREKRVAGPASSIGQKNVLRESKKGRKKGEDVVERRPDHHVCRELPQRSLI